MRAPQVRIKALRSALLGLAASAAILVPVSAQVSSQPTATSCVDVAVCTGSVPGCIKVPTSLPAVSTVADPHGWISAEGNCGTKRRIWCLPFPRVACGPPLASAACP